MVRKKDEKKIDPEEPKIDPEMLTPWQKENLKYLEQSGEKPNWVDESIMQKITQEDEIDAANEEALDDEQNASGETENVPVEAVEEDLKEIKDLPKSKSFADKLPKMKKERRKRLKKRLTIIITIFGVTAAGLIYYVSPISKLDKLEILGNEKVTKEAIAKATKLRHGEFYWKAYFAKDTENNVLKDQPRIKKVNKSVSSINNIKLTVKEFHEIAYAKENDVFHPVLENGIILPDVVEATNEKFPILINVTNEKELVKLVGMYKGLKGDIKNNIKEIHYNPTESNKSLITMFMKDGNEVIGSTFDLLKKIDYYPEVVKSMNEDGIATGIIDMEAGVYAKSFETRDKQIQEEKEREEAERIQKAIEKEIEEANAQENNENINE